MRETPLLVASGLKKSFKIGKQTLDVLRAVEFSAQLGEIVILLGASGAGKTTLLHTLAGLDRPDEGLVEFDGRDIYALSDSQRARLRNRRMGFIFQSYHLLPELTAIENVTLPRRISGPPDADAARKALEKVGLAERLHHLPGELSGGEQQRVAIARALVNDPAVIFADEPTGNLDSNTGNEIMGLLLTLSRIAGKTLIMVTHDELLAKKGDRLVRMKDGRVVPA